MMPSVFIVNSIGRAPASTVPYKTLSVEQWTYPTEKDGEEDARNIYFSDICRLTCTEETKTSISNQISLWKHISETDNLPEYVMVLEDDNTIRNEKILSGFTNITAAMKQNKIDMLQLVTPTRMLKDKNHR